MIESGVVLDLSSYSMQVSRRKSMTFSTSGRRRNGFVNRVCLGAIIGWLEEDFGFKAEPYLGFHNLNSTWEFVNGTIIEVEGARIALIPTLEENPTEIYIPWEWVDIKRFAADCYWAITLNTEALWLEIWGISTYEQVLHIGEKDNYEKVYSLPFSVLSSNMKKLPNIQQSIKEISITKNSAMRNANTTDFSEEKLFLPSKEKFPRLGTSFKEWSKIFSNDDIRNAIYNSRRKTRYINPIENDEISLEKWTELDADKNELGWVNMNLIYDDEFASVVKEDKRSRILSFEYGKKMVFKELDEDISFYLVLKISGSSKDASVIDMHIMLIDLENGLPKGLELVFVADLSGIHEAAQVVSGGEDCLNLSTEFALERGDEFTVEVYFKENLRSFDFVV
jgi:hypothetical protein